MPRAGMMRRQAILWAVSRSASRRSSGWPRSWVAWPRRSGPPGRSASSKAGTIPRCWAGRSSPRCKGLAGESVAFAPVGRARGARGGRGGSAGAGAILGRRPSATVRTGRRADASGASSAARNFGAAWPFSRVGGPMKTLDELLFMMVEAEGVRPAPEGREPPGHPRRRRIAAARPAGVLSGGHEGLRGLDHERQADPPLQRGQRDRLRLQRAQGGPLPRERVPAAGEHLDRHAPGGHARSPRSRI